MNRINKSRHVVIFCMVAFSVTCVIGGPMARKARAEAAAKKNIVNMEIDSNAPVEETKNVQEPPPVDNAPIDEPPTNQAEESVANEEQPLDQNTQAEAASNEEPDNTQKETPRKEEEIDWGHTTNDWDENVEVQQKPDVAQEQTDKQRDEQTDEQRDEKTEGTQQNVGDVGVINPEEVMHGDEVHGDHHGDAKVPSQENMADEKLARESAEKEELQILQPQVKPNVHDNKERTAAEFMKDRQFGPGDIEEIIHGGHHVHGEENEMGRGQIQAGDIESIAHGQDGVPKEKDTKVASTLDPEELMHAGQGAGHDHNPHHVKEKQASPGLQTPEGTNLQGHAPEQEKKVKVHIDRDDIGPTFEKAVHGSDSGHVHDHTDDQDNKPRKKVTYKDIIDLGLSQEMLKGIDLSGLLEQEKQEFEDWKKDTEANNQIGGVEDSTYWQEVKDLRKHYLEKLYAKVKEISQPDLENAEWDEEDDHIRGLQDSHEPHNGESQVEHEMEMWASTAAKGDRLSHKAKFGRRGMNEEDEKDKTEEKEEDENEEEHDKDAEEELEPEEDL